jgi:histone-lysine N-methyltransferase SETDB1
MPIPIDCFMFSPDLSPTLEFRSAPGVFSCEDLTKGLEAVPISCVNLFNSDRPDVVRNKDYSATRVYDNDRVRINTDVDFLVCCSCENDCSDPRTCACQLLTEYQVWSLRSNE